MKMARHDDEYLKLVDEILTYGVQKDNRTDTGTIGLFAKEMRFDLSDNSIPLLTTKKMHTKSIIHELLWFLSGSTNVAELHKNKITIWDEWADDKGELGPIYGKQWRRWGRRGERQIDQIDQLIQLLKTDPNSRRMLVSAWNPEDIPKMALPPCHYSFQTWAHDERLSMLVNQRSCDMGLGVPFNIAQYSILLHMIAKIVDMKPGEFIWRGGDVHIYNNHIESLVDQLQREPFDSPTLELNDYVVYIDHFHYDDFSINGYQYHPTIKLDVAV